ncbi:hypothetical protein BHM03_00024621 [Ensete ventricosum]|nr:hypothetical protein BHM03_00024621 [Ensete ventricosum]
MGEGPSAVASFKSFLYHSGFWVLSPWSSCHSGLQVLPSSYRISGPSTMVASSPPFVVTDFGSPRHDFGSRCNGRIAITLDVVVVVCIANALEEQVKGDELVAIVASRVLVGISSEL